MRNDIEFKTDAARLALLAGWTAGKIANYRDGSRLLRRERNVPRPVRGGLLLPRLRDAVL